jgi:hypothetical protein
LTFQMITGERPVFERTSKIWQSKHSNQFTLNHFNKLT